MTILMAVIWYMLIGTAAMVITGVVIGITGAKKNGAVAAQQMGHEMLEQSENECAKKPMLRIIGGMAVGLLIWPFTLAVLINGILNTYFTKDEKTE